MMEQKLIKLTASKSKMMNFDEVVAQYKNYMCRASHKWQMNYEFDELYQMSLIGCWKAFKSYTGEVLFLTYAATCIQNEILMYVRKARGCILEGRQVKQIVSLEDVLNFDSEGSELLLQDIIGEVDYNIESIGEKEILNNLLKRLNKKQREEIEGFVFKSITQKELGQKYGISQSYASRRARKTLFKMKRVYLREMAL